MHNERPHAADLTLAANPLVASVVPRRDYR